MGHIVIGVLHMGQVMPMDAVDTSLYIFHTYGEYGMIILIHINVYTPTVP